VTGLSHIVCVSPVSLRLRVLREARGLTQAELARRSGVRRETINRLESGGAETRLLATFEKLARALDVALVDLLDGAKNAKKTRRRSP
jgi:putative transcriptional regulator